MDTSIAVLIIFFNKLSQTISCIESFLESGCPIYVLNNASEEKSWLELQEHFAGVGQLNFFRSSENIGPARGRNFLIDQSKEEWLFMVDNDITISPAAEWRNIFLNSTIRHPDINIFCPRLFNVHENQYADICNFEKNGNKITMVPCSDTVSNYFPCGAVIVNKKTFEIYGKLDDKLFAFEDYEFSIRAICSSIGEFKIQTIPEITLRHDHQFQTNKADKKSVLERYNTEKIRQSMNRVMTKHHIIFDHEWEWWTKKQIRDMNGVPVMQKFVELIRRGFQKVVRK